MIAEKNQMKNEIIKSNENNALLMQCYTIYRRVNTIIGFMIINSLDVLT